MDDKTKSYSLSIPESIYNKIKDLADKDRRSVSAMVTKILEDHLHKQGVN